MTRRRIEMALGALWLLDGALQLQPAMFSSAFFSNVLGMANMGLPGPVARVDFALTDMVLWHPVVWNASFAGVQLAIGVALLRGGRWARWGRPASVAWALAVWVVGEGLGGMFMGGSSVLNGAPGPAILYALVTLLVWPRRDGDGTVRAGGLLGRWALAGWTALWMTVALLEVAGPNHLATVPGAEIRNGAAGEPTPLAALNHAVGRLVGFHGAQFALALGVAAAEVGVLALWRPLRRPALAAGMVLITFIGVVGGDLGGIFTGSGTDPGLAPLGVLIGLALWPGRDRAVGELPDAIPLRGGTRRRPGHPVPVAAR